MLFYLFHKKKSDYKFQLELSEPLKENFYRERNFCLNLVLKDRSNNVIPNVNMIPISIALYTSENPPKYIDSNTQGSKIMKGIIDKDLL